MKTTTKNVTLWPGVHAVEATISRHVDLIDVTSFGMDKRQYIKGPTHESVRMGIICDVQSYELLSALLQSPVDFDPTSEHFVLRVPSRAVANATPLMASDMKEVPFRKIVLE